MICRLWQQFGNVIRLTDLLSSARICINDLPKLDHHVENRGGNRLCFQHILGYCPHLVRGRCHSVHIDGPDLPNNVVGEVCRLLAPGVDSVMGDGNINNRGDGWGGGHDVRQQH